MPVAVFIILEKDENVWLQRRANTGYRDGYYDLPAGHVDPGESVKTAAIRELKEEAGVDVDVDDLVGVHAMHNNDEADYINIFFRAKKWSGEPRNAEPEKCDEAGWFPLSALPQPMIPHVMLAFQSLRSDLAYSESWRSDHK